MPVSEGYLVFVLDQLRPTLPGVRARRMFGGVGLYADELFFAVVDDDTLYFKVDDVTREEFTARGMPQFHPMPDMPSMNYYQLPEEVLEEPEPLRAWTQRAVDVARRARAARTAKGKGRATSKGSVKARTAKKPAKKAAKKSVRRDAKSSTKRSAPPRKRSR